MVKMQVLYEGDLRSVVTHEPSGDQIHTDAPVDNHGKGLHFSPTDLVAAALATCVATVLGIAAERKKWDLIGLKIEVEKEMSQSPPRRVSHIHLKIMVPQGIESSDRAHFEQIAKNCPVHHSLSSEIKIDYEFVY